MDNEGNIHFIHYMILMHKLLSLYLVTKNKITMKGTFIFFLSSWLGL